MFSAKKIIVIALIALVLIGIPVTIYLLQQQQEVRSHAQAASTLGFTPSSTPSSPIQAKVDDVIDLKLSVDPSSNLVSFVRLEIQYDSSKLATASGTGGADAFEPNKIAFPTINEGPVYEDGKILVTLSVGSDPTKAIQTPTEIGTLHLRALAGTDTPTQVIYGTQTQVLSIGSSDQASENVLSSSTPAVIDIVTPTTVETPTPEITEVPTDTPTPTLTQAANQAPVCTSLTADVTSGTAPLAVGFTIVGNDSDGTITKADIDFNDGNKATLTDGLGVASISATTEHTFSSGGTFNVSATLTDDAGGSGTSAACLQTISVAGPTATPTAGLTDTPTPTIAGADTPTPTLASPGPGAAIIGLGAFFSVLSVIGAILFFAL